MLDIEADSREQSSGIPRLLADKLGCSVRVRPLPVGDYTAGQLAIERKTASDLARSIADGRAFDQARRVTSAFSRVVLIVEGLFPPPACDGHEDAYIAALAQLALSFGIHVLPTRFPLDSALLISRLAQAEFDLIASPASHLDPRRHRKPRQATDRRLFLCQGFFGIGPERARNLLHSFGSLRSLFCAPEDAWREVPGVGPRLARQMRELLDDEAPLEPAAERSAG
ncbi:MAG: hypothetical protein HUU15_13855 [Candidatus Brocadiae bacterium]|nr:hypothetical protein [Candidatus Brocadiia bacterium]